MKNQTTIQNNGKFEKTLGLDFLKIYWEQETNNADKTKSGLQRA